MLISDRRLMGAADGDAARFGDAIARALDGVAAGSALVQVREKDLGGRALAALVRAAIAAARPRGARVLVNDRLDVALACGADGVHLPEDGLDVPAARAAGAPFVGVSRHSLDAAIAAAHGGVDAIQLGPLFATPSKAAYGAPLGVAALAAARRALDELRAGARPLDLASRTAADIARAAVHDRRGVAVAGVAGSVPLLVAVGGIDSPVRAREAFAAGADAVAVIRAVWTAVDPATAARALADAAP